jgi:hypothetical protein
MSFKPTFNFIPENERSMYTTAYNAITQLELWDYMRNFNEESFMFSSAKEVSKIYEKIGELGYGGHSGASFGFIMRQMQQIAKNGLQEYISRYIIS